MCTYIRSRPSRYSYARILRLPRRLLPQTSPPSYVVRLLSIVDKCPPVKAAAKRDLCRYDSYMRSPVKAPPLGPPLRLFLCNAYDGQMGNTCMRPFPWRALLHDMVLCLCTSTTYMYVHTTPPYARVILHVRTSRCTNTIISIIDKSCTYIRIDPP